jgi:hypothetical protein
MMRVAGDRHRVERDRSIAKRLQHTGRILGLEQPQDHVERAPGGHVAAEIVGDGAGRAGLWPPSSQSSAPAWKVIRQRPRPEPLQARRPFRPAERRAQGGVADHQPILMAQHRDGQRRVHGLVRPLQARQRQLELAVPVPILDLLAISDRVPGAGPWQPDRAGLPGHIAHPAGDLAGVELSEERHAGFGDAGLFPRDRLDARAQKGLMIEPELGDAADQRPLDHVGGVEPATEADLDDAGIGRVPAESEERRLPW